MICVVVSAASAVVVKALNCVPLRAPICETLSAAMSVVFRFAIVVVDRLAICAFERELMKDDIANPQGDHRRPIRARITIDASRMRIEIHIYFIWTR